VFLDHERLEGAAAWPDRLETAARRAAVMLALVGEGWLRALDPSYRDLRELAGSISAMPEAGTVLQSY
jgi:hypothetical protein